MKIFVETNRLILREIIPEDVDALFELDADPEVHKYLGNKPLVEKVQVVEIIEFIRQQYEENGIGRWAVIEKSTHQFVGWCGLKLVKELTNNHINYYDVGYRLIRKYWGNGYATESALASLKYGFEVLKVNDIYACAHYENVASNHVLNKIGMQCLEQFEHFGSTHHWYHISRD